METITITDAHAVVYAPDEFGGRCIINLLNLGVLRIPMHSMKGKTGADIGWSAHRDAKITEDYRYES